MKKGDIFSWRYKDSAKRGQFAYWCKSQIAEYDGSYLYDTFWGNDHTEKSWLPNYPDDIELTFIANREDLIPLREYDKMYYDEKDVVDLTHSNSFGNQIFLRKGAKRSRSAMLQHLTDKMDKAHHEIKMAEQTLREASGKISCIEAGANLEEIWL